MIEKPLTQITWDAEAAEKGGYEHFMMKEIHEQPKAVRDTLGSVVKDGADRPFRGGTDGRERSGKSGQIYIVACGSAYHVGVAAKYVIEDLAQHSGAGGSGLGIPLSQAAACGADDLVVIISQSGETADSLAALREAKEQGVPDAGDRQRGGQFHRPRGGQCVLHAGGAGDRRGDHQGVLARS